MITRRFTGSNVSDALRQVRAAFGPDAVILETRQGRVAMGGGTSGAAAVTVTAGYAPRKPSADVAPNSEGPKRLSIIRASEEPGQNIPSRETHDEPESIATDSTDRSAPTMPDVTERSNSEWSAALDRLDRVVRQWHDEQTYVTPWSAMRRWLVSQKELSSGLVDAFATHLSETLPPCDSFLETRRSPMTALYVGARGTGRSMALFKSAAARWTVGQQAPHLAVIAATPDHGQERMLTWGERCGIPCGTFAADDTSDLKAWKREKGADLLVELVPPRPSDDLEKLARTVRRSLLPDAVVLVLSATGSAAAWRRECDRFSVFRPTHLLLSHWDELQPWWEVFQTARHAGLLPSYRVFGIDPIDGIEPFTSTDLRTGIAEHLSLEIQSPSRANATAGVTR